MSRVRRSNVGHSNHSREKEILLRGMQMAGPNKKKRCSTLYVVWQASKARQTKAEEVLLNDVPERKFTF